MQSRNDFLKFLIEFSTLILCWLILTIAAQYCVLADTFGNNWFFIVTDTVTTYVMHLILAKIASNIILAYFFPQANTIYVGLPQITRDNVYELFAIINAIVLVVTYF
jgi:hypothetical protein